LPAQRNNYEILKMLLDRGASIPIPHDVKCGCDECVEASNDDSLRFDGDENERIWVDAHFLLLRAVWPDLANFRLLGDCFLRAVFI
jgi:hypothetical protein